MLLKNQWVNEETKEEVRKYLETNENGNTKIGRASCRERV